MTTAEANTTENAAIAEQGAQVTPKKTAAKKGASQKKDTAKSQKAVKKPAAKKDAKPAAKKAAKGAKAEKSQPREGSKKQIVLDLLRRKDGATMAEIAKATGWQAHSIRGFISGTLTKKMDLPVASVKNDAGERCYRIEK